jgi:hypothetical protein
LQLKIEKTFGRQSGIPMAAAADTPFVITVQLTLCDKIE